MTKTPLLWFKLLIASTLVLVILKSPPAFAALACYDDNYYPAVSRLENTDTGLRVYLHSSKFMEEVFTMIEGNELQVNVHAAPPVSQQAWRVDQTVLCLFSDGDCINRMYRKGDSCAGKLPSIQLSMAEATRLRPELTDLEGIDQRANACAEQGDDIWFGISFYDGEGYSGVGGIGKYDLKTRKHEIRRPELLVDTSIDEILYDGKYFWLTTSGHYECTGSPPTYGLLRYNWDSDTFKTFAGKDNGPCGVVINDLLQTEDALWAATDLGLSRLDKSTGDWKHYKPDLKASQPVQETTCPKLYDELLEQVPDENIEAGPNPRQQLIESLAFFRLGYLSEQTILDRLAQFSYYDSASSKSYYRGGKETTVEQLAQGAEQGDAEAQSMLGYHYTSRLNSEAAMWLHKAAHQGVAKAQYNLGLLYGKGWGVTQDLGEANKWFHKAAEQGLVDAQFMLGLLYANDQKNNKRTEAIGWLEKAADQGNYQARRLYLLMKYLN